MRVAPWEHGLGAPNADCLILLQTNQTEYSNTTPHLLAPLITPTQAPTKPGGRRRLEHRHLPGSQLDVARRQQLEQPRPTRRRAARTRGGGGRATRLLPAGTLAGPGLTSKPAPRSGRRARPWRRKNERSRRPNQHRARHRRPLPLLGCPPTLPCRRARRQVPSFPRPRFVCCCICGCGAPFGNVRSCGAPFGNVRSNFFLQAA